MKLNPDVRPEQLQQKIRRLGEWELMLQIGASVFVLLMATGFIGVTLPYTSKKLGISGIHDPLLFYVLLGLIALGVIFGLIVYKQRQALSQARERLAVTALGVEGAENLSMVDPLTGLLNQEYFDRSASKEMALAERTGLSLTFFMVQVRGSEAQSDHSKPAAGDRVLLGVAELLRTTFRGSDTVVRYSDDEFVASMPGCNEQQAQGAAERFLAQVDHWNQENTNEANRMSLRYCTAPYANGASIATLVETLREKMRDLQCVQANGEMVLSSETEKPLLTATEKQP